MIKEYVAAKIWPLTSGWLPNSFSKVKFGQLTESIPYPNFGLVRPNGLSDEEIVAAVKQDVVVLAGPHL